MEHSPEELKKLSKLENVHRNRKHFQQNSKDLGNRENKLSSARLDSLK